MQHKFFRNLAELMYALDRLADIVKHFIAQRFPSNKRISIGRFYTIIPNVVLPVIVGKHDKDLVFKGSIEPSTILHIHENYVFISKSLSIDTDSIYRNLIMYEEVPGISLTESDDVILSLLAVAIAEKVVRDPELGKAIKLLPNNLRTLVEKAREFIKEEYVDISEISYRIPKIINTNIKRASIIELKLWTSKNRSIDLPYEISYTKSFGVGYLRLRYIGGELDIRTISFGLADNIMPKLLPNSIIEEMISNTWRAMKVITATLRLLDNYKTL